MPSLPTGNGIARGNEAITIEESLPVVSLSQKANDKAVFGVLSNGEDDNNRRKYERGYFVSLLYSPV